MKRILVIQLRELGDVLLTTPLVRQLQRLYPMARIDFVCESKCASLLQANPRLERVHSLASSRATDFLRLAYQLRRGRYDLVVDGQCLPKTALLARITGARQRCGYLRSFPRNRFSYTDVYRHDHSRPMYVALQKLLLLADQRIDPLDLSLEFPIDQHAEAAADRFAQQYLRPPVVAVYVASRFDSKRWPAAKYAALIDRLQQRGFQPWLVYGPGQEATARQVAANSTCRPVVDYPALDLPTLRGVLARCCIFVGNDGGPRHIACAAGRPTFTIFGLDHPQVWIPPHCPQHRFITAGLADQASAQGRWVTAASFHDIPVEVVWHDIELWLRMPEVGLASSLGDFKREGNAGRQ